MKHYPTTAKTIILFLVVISSSTLSVMNCVSSYNTKDEAFFYGFVISYVKLDNLTIESQINEDISHMINDLLRENLSVYWTADDKNLTIKELNNSEEKNMLFEKGSFIIPFTNNTTIDIKIMVIISEYNQSRELSIKRTYKVPIFLISEPIVINAYPLNKVKIAHYRDLLTSCDFLYLEAAQDQGFLDFVNLDFFELKDRLNYKDFNLIVIPGAGAGYLPKDKTILKFSTMILQDVIYGAANAVRNFVGNEGGGYVGSCYGAYKASCGVSESFVYLKRRAYNPNLNSIALFAISDAITKQPDPAVMGSVEIKILNHSHPLVYSISKDTVIDHHYGGPIFTYLGGNSKAVGEFQNTGYLADEKPGWVSTNFGKGKAILFSPHPEYLAVLGNQTEAEIGKRLVGNSFFYTASEPRETIDKSLGYNLSFIENKFIEINDLSLSEFKTNYCFNETKQKINETIDDIHCLIDNTSKILDKIQLIAEDNGIDTQDREYKFYLGLDVVKDTYYTYNLFKTELLKSLEILNKFEKLYSLDENNEGLCTQIKNLKIIITGKLNFTDNMVDETFKIFSNYNKDLDKYKNVKTKIMKNILETLVTKNMNSLYVNTRELLDNIPQVYFNSLKSIRTAYYNYKVSIIL